RDFPMSSRPLKINNQSVTRNDAILDEATPRLVLAMDGEVIFSNAAGDAIAGCAMKGQNFLTLAQFDDAEDAFRHSPLLFAQENLIFSALRSGLHSVVFSETGARIELQFDN